MGVLVATSSPPWPPQGVRGHSENSCILICFLDRHLCHVDVIWRATGEALRRLLMIFCSFVAFCELHSLSSQIHYFHVLAFVEIFPLHL